MVHYNPPRHTAQHPAPRCPKCGSHRTEIVGMSEDQGILHVRCTACGTRSEVPAREATPA